MNFMETLVSTTKYSAIQTFFLEFYGFMPWVLIQRITLPLAVFFRFHSAVVSIELWKEVYCEKNEQDQNHQIDMDTLPSNVRRPNQQAVYF